MNKPEFVTVYPDTTHKHYSKAGNTILSVVIDLNKTPSNNLIVEAYTDIKRKATDKNFYSLPLHLKRTDHDLAVFETQINPKIVGIYQIQFRFKQKNDTKWTNQEKSVRFLVEPNWAKSVVLYNAFVRQFGAKDKDNDGIIEPGEGGTFNDLIEAMPHFETLGIGAFYLNPIHTTGETKYFKYQDHTNSLPHYLHPGSVYSVKDYKSIDPELGLNPDNLETDQYNEFKRFVQESHDRGIRVILDIVFDHTAHDSFIQKLHPEWFLYKHQTDSLEEPFIIPGEEGWGDPAKTFSPYDHGIFWTDCALVNWEMENHAGVKLAPNNKPTNPSIKDMWNYFSSVCTYWIKNYGVDGFRCDVSYAVPTEFWTFCINNSRKAAREIIKNKQAIRPLSEDILFIGESYVDKLEELFESGISAINGDYSHKIYTVSGLKGYLDYIYNLSGKFFPQNSLWVLFPECHDFHRLPVKFQNQLKFEHSDVQLAKSRWVLNATLPGLPLLFNGYEKVEYSPLSVITYNKINWDSKKDITQYLGKINHIRNQHIALQHGNYVFVDTEQGVNENAQLYAFIREYGNETILVVVNMDFNHKADLVTLNLPATKNINFNKKYSIKDLINNKTYKREDKFLSIILEPGESHIFLVKQLS